jgi:hypothetical protein
MSDHIAAEIIQVNVLKELPKGTYKVLLAPSAADAIKEYSAKYAGKHGMPATIYQHRALFYFSVDIDGTGA